MIGVRRLLAIGLLVLPGCLGLGCPCGSDPADPFSEHDPTYPGSHVLEAECVCRCGADDPVAVARDGDCREHEGACVDGSGAPAQRRCE